MPSKRSYQDASSGNEAEDERQRPERVHRKEKREVEKHMRTEHQLASQFTAVSAIAEENTPGKSMARILCP